MTESLAYFLLWLLSNNHESVFLEILYFALKIWASLHELTVCLPALRVRHDESITLACKTSVQELRQWVVTHSEHSGPWWSGGLQKSEKPPDIQCVTQSRVVTPEAGWRTGATGLLWGQDRVILTGSVRPRSCVRVHVRVRPCLCVKIGH